MKLFKSGKTLLAIFVNHGSNYFSLSLKDLFPCGLRRYLLLTKLAERAKSICQAVQSVKPHFIKEKTV